MKAIIIEEERFAELTLLLGGAAKHLEGRRPEGITQDCWEALIDDVRRSFHLEFVRWAQSHGASCVRR